MRYFYLLISVIFTISSCKNDQIVNCRIITTEGNIDLEIYPDKAPLTVSNFLKYVDNQLYEESSFFMVCTPENEKTREIKIEVIQGGKVKEELCFEPVKIETTNHTKIKHLNGTISMARDKPNSATSQFFICIGTQAELDYKGKRNPDGLGFAAFGKVTSGMDIVKKIQMKKENNQILVEPVIIKSINRL